MLKIKNFSYRYQSRANFTLHDISLELSEGEMLLLAGHSGCGKSTLIKAISGLLCGEQGQTLGNIYLDGMDVAKLKPEQIGLLAGTVYQSPDDQLFAMTAGDEVGFALENQGLEYDFIRSRVKEAMAMVGLAGFEEYGIHQLSGGQRQRLALASILVTRPKLLILDEPVSQMNPQGVKSFLELLLRLNKEENISILMIEHRVNELAEYFPKLAVMEQGRIIYDGCIEQAWPILAAKGDVGVREPQSVKLCRELQLSRLTSNNEQIVELIKRECQISYIKEADRGKAILSPENPRSTHNEHINIDKGKMYTIANMPITAKNDKKNGQENILLEVQHVFYTYPGATEPTLKDLSFTIPEGKIVALMGFNGAGKSTLMNILGGLSELERGEIKLGGKCISNALDGVGYLRQEPDLMLLADTVEQELCWNNKLMTSTELEELLGRLKLTEYRHDFPLALSKGQRLRVVLGSMLARRPKLLLLDEPTTGQDEQSLNEIKRLLLSYKNAGGSVFICTHDVELAAELADRVLLLRQGEILVDGAARNILSDKAYLRESGLNATAILDISERLNIPNCILAKEVKHYVSTSAMGGQ